MANETVDITEKLSLFSEHWSPKVVARLNDYEIKVVKVKGEFVWHTHAASMSCSSSLLVSGPFSCATAP